MANTITYFGTFYSKICNLPYYGSGSRCDYTLTTHCDHSILHDVNLCINLTIGTMPLHNVSVGVVNSPRGRRKDTCCMHSVESLCG